MKNLFYKLLAALMGKNVASTPSQVVISQMNEPRPLPVGMTEFEEWSDRIISGTMLPATDESMKFGLATMLMHLPPTTDHESDGYFIKSLRKSAVNQIAHAKMQELRDAAKARLEAEEEAAKLKLVQPSEVTPINESVTQCQSSTNQKNSSN